MNLPITQKTAWSQLLWYAALIVAVGCSASVPSAPPLLLVELNYWEKTSPLLEKAILEGGTPFADVYMDNLSGLTRGDQQAWANVAIGAQKALPVYKSLFNEWIKIQPPGAGMAGSAHTANGLAWGERVMSLELMAASWDTQDFTTFQEGLDRSVKASELGRQAESLRIEFNTHLISQCEKYRAHSCLK